MEKATLVWVELAWPLQGEDGILKFMYLGFQAVALVRGHGLCVTDTAEAASVAN